MPRRSRSQAFPAPVQHEGRIAVRAEEGIVPGLDFCNHDPRSPVRWTVWGGCGNTARLLKHLKKHSIKGVVLLGGSLQERACRQASIPVPCGLL